MKAKKLSLLIIMMFTMICITMLKPRLILAEVESTDVVKIGDEGYATLEEAVEVANNSDTPITITLLSDISLNKKMVINKDITIEGNYSIIRAKDDPTTIGTDEAYIGRLFEVSVGAKLTLDGDITIDGGNNWIFKEEEYFAKFQYRLDYYEGKLPEGSPAPSDFYGFAFVTSEQGKKISNDHLLVINGEIVINKATLTNHCADGEKNVLRLGKNAIAKLNAGAKIVHNAITSRGTAIFMADESLVYINDGAEISDNYAAYNGGSIYNNGGTITMNGGKISNNHAVRTNGTAIMLHQNNATFIMNGGEICNNSGLPAEGAGHCCAIYLHSTGIFEMNGGSICHNTGMTVGAVMGMSSNSKMYIKGGYIGENENIYASNPNYGSLDMILGHADVLSLGAAKITGGTFTQDVSEYCENEYYYVPDPDAGENEKGTVSICPRHVFENSVCTLCKYNCPHSTTATEDKEATCVSKAYCSVCENEYGEFLEHNYTYVENEEENTINKTCDLGCNCNETIKLESPENLVYTEKEIEVILTGDVNEEVEIVYDTVDGKAPKKAGKYKATVTYGNKSVSVEFEIKEVIPEITIKAPTPSLIPGTSVMIEAQIKNPENEKATNLPTEFIIKYRIDEEETIYEIEGLKLTLPIEVTLGKTIYVYVENKEVLGEYKVGQSNVLEFIVGQKDYSKDIEKVRNELSESIDKLYNYLKDADLVTRVETLEKALDNVNKIISEFPDEYATKQEVKELEERLKKLITNTKTEVLGTIRKELKETENNLEILINDLKLNKADKEELENAVKELNEKIASSEENLKVFVKEEDKILKEYLESLIEEAKLYALEKAEKELNEAVDKLNKEIKALQEGKLDKTEFEKALKSINESIKLSETLSKAYTDEQTKILKSLIEVSIKDTKDFVNEAIESVNKNLTEKTDKLNEEIKALQDGKIDKEEYNKAIKELSEAIELTNSTIEEFKEESKETRKQLEASLETLNEILEGTNKELEETRKELEEKINQKASDITEEMKALNDKIKETETLINILDASTKESNKLLEERIKKLEEEHEKSLKVVKDLLNKTIEDLNETKELLDTKAEKEELKNEVKALEEKIENAKKYATEADEELRTELLELINKMQKELEEFKKESDVKDQELENKTKALDNTIEIIFIFVIFSVCGVVISIIWLLINNKKIKRRV